MSITIRPLREPYHGYTWRCEGYDGPHYASALGHDGEQARRRWQAKIDEEKYRAEQARIERGRPNRWSTDHEI